MTTISQLYEIYLQHPEITTDSRQCTEGAIFFALKGPSFNGNAYAQKALEAGCAYAVVDEAAYATDARCLLVDDVLKSLQELAAYHRRHLSIPVLQITGTNGKTTTKELVSAVLSRKYRTLYTQGNLNNHIGVPRTLLRINSTHEIAVVETGANHPGEIADLCRMVQADYGLITNVGRAHLEGFGSFEGVKRTKGELYDDLLQRGKTIFLNPSDENLLAMAQEREGLQSIPYVEARISKVVPFVEVQWRTAEGEPWHTVATHLVGAYNVFNVRAAVTVGLHFGVPAEEIDLALASYTPTNSRSEMRKTEHNTLIVDAYNANPTSMAAALDSFQYVEDKNKMVVLGEMRELGANSEAEHLAIVQRLLKSDIATIWLVGDCFCRVATIADDRVKCFADIDAVKGYLAEHPICGATILIKGSNGTRLYQLPELL